MYCTNCGKEISEGSNFCSNCGFPINESKEVVTKVMTCKTCGGQLKLDGDEPVLSCPYCGSKELIIENKDVSIARIQSAIELKKEQMRYQYIQERYQADDKKKRREEYRKNDTFGTYLWFGVYFAIFGIMGLTIAVLGHELSPIYFITLLLLIVQASLWGYSAYLDKKNFVNNIESREHFKWFGYGLAVMIANIILVYIFSLF